MVESVRVPKNCPGEYGKRSNLCEYGKTVESVRVPGIGRIRESAKKLSGRKPENATILASAWNR